MYLGSSLLGSKILSFPFHWMCGTGSPSAWHWNMAVCPWYTVVGSGSSLKVTKTGGGEGDTRAVSPWHDAEPTWHSGASTTARPLGLYPRGWQSSSTTGKSSGTAQTSVPAGTCPPGDMRERGRWLESPHLPPRAARWRGSRPAGCWRRCRCSSPSRSCSPCGRTRRRRCG